MNENGGVQFLRRRPNRLERRVVEIQRIKSTLVRICIDMRSDLRAAQA